METQTEMPLGGNSSVHDYKTTCNASEIGQQNHEHVQVKGRFTIDLYGPTRRQITPALECATSSKLGALLLAEGYVVRSTLLTRTPEIHQKSSNIYALEMHQETWGDL